MSEETLDHQFFKDRRCLKAKVSRNKLLKIKQPWKNNQLMNFQCLKELQASRFSVPELFLAESEYNDCLWRGWLTVGVSHLVSCFCHPWRVGVKPHLDNPCLCIWQHFDMPHDIVASEDGNVYIGDAHTNTVWKFTLTESMLLRFFTCLFVQYF